MKGGNKVWSTRGGGRRNEKKYLRTRKTISGENLGKKHVQTETLKTARSEAGYRGESSEIRNGMKIGG